MAFYWKGDQLFTKRGPSPPAEGVSAEEHSWTSFYLKLRDREDVPNADSFGRFIALAVAFTVNLSHIGVYGNKNTIVKITKKVSNARPLEGFKTSSVKKVSARNIFTLTSAEVATIQIEVEKVVTSKSIAKAIMSAFISVTSNKTEPEYEKFAIFARVAVGRLDVRLPQKFEKDMERTTKKPPPSRTMIQMILAGNDEYEASISICNKNPTFREVIPYPEQGRIFIGFATHQTTGCPCHLAAHLIPTVSCFACVTRCSMVWLS
jgi:hypothetical protein